MNELIPIHERDGIDTVNARELHKFLGSKRHFSDWIKQRIETYGFSHGQDFTVHKSVIGKATQYDYHVTIDMAKELSMVENNERGRQARRYFIAMEKKTKAITSPELSEAMIVKKALEIQNEKIRVLSIKAQVADEIANSEGLFLPSTVGKMVMGNPNKFCQWLVDEGVMFRRGSGGALIPKSPYDQKSRGYFKVKVTKFEDKSTFQTYFTPRGVAWIQARYLQRNNLLSMDF